MNRHVAVYVEKPVKRHDQTPGAMMVGRTIDHPRYGPVFLHQHSGTQYHGQTRCPCPVDAVLVDWLMAEGIAHFYAHDRKRGTLLHATVAALVEAERRADGGRQRLYLPEAAWDHLADIGEERGQGRTVLSHQGKPFLAWRFAGDQVTLNPFASLV